MRKIALIVSKGSRYGKNNYLQEFLQVNDTVYNFYGMWETPNLSLLTIAGILPENYDIQFIDEDHGQEIDFSQFYDIVALTGMTQQINRTYEIADRFREQGIYVVIGGIHATLLPKEAKQHADSVMVGEGEALWKEFISDYDTGTCREIYESKGYIDLKTSPVPRYDLVDKRLYTSYSIQTTRGCPRSCDYCTLPIMYGSTYRHKTIEQIVNEIKAIKKVDKDAFIFFADDNMFINRDFSFELLEKISTMNIKWGTQTDISVANDTELLKLIHKAGCHWMFIGFENVSESGLKFLDRKQWKAKQLEAYTDSIEKIHKAGLNIWASFMFGGDNDTNETFKKTLDFALDNGIYSGSFTILTPLPGTKLYDDMKEQNRIIDYDWSRYTFWDTVYKPNNLTSDELSKGVAWVYSNFYSKENVIRRTQLIKKRIKDYYRNEARV
ncbi:radical SAM superfamily enzyme YgiQ (UPF0313 family) [Lachnotalea glycerini]|uniref:Radical SAM superfamily enzyme YgiQ (UPF0313 family) n=1 Tax=Lachnotalea glycerini TaxID=1763509 RepID=A0A318EWG1_9FIRM|nr:radical SAM protein [Lachnotalea glycerini]PXV95587.1 radical SAM superfamily enzyme YgiQ (UPF0313 family) [Lachnotalea glycerini]